MSKIQEIWKPLLGYHVRYEVSNYGNIKSTFPLKFSRRKGWYKRPDYLLKIRVNSLAIVI